MVVRMRARYAVRGLVLTSASILYARSSPCRRATALCLSFRSPKVIAVVGQARVNKLLGRVDAMFFQHHHEHLGIHDRAGVEQFHRRRLSQKSASISRNFSEQRSPSTRPSPRSWSLSTSRTAGHRGCIVRAGRPLLWCPEGTIEDSSAFQRWVGRQRSRVPKGRLRSSHTPLSFASAPGGVVYRANTGSTSKSR